MVCWIVCVEYLILYGGQSCYIDFKSLAFAIWTSDVLSFVTIHLTSSSGITHAIFDPHIQNRPIPCANLVQTSLHLEARHHAIHQKSVVRQKSLCPLASVCLGWLSGSMSGSALW